MDTLTSPLRFYLILSWVLACALIGGGSTSAGAHSDAPDSPPNIILILTDDQGWTSMSTPMDRNRPDARSDFHRTPHMDRLAARGMRFSNGYSSAPVCSPSRYSILYGKTPARLGKTLVRGPNRVYHAQPSLPKLLKEVDARYRCAHFGKWHLDVEPDVVGYDESDGMTGGRDGGFTYGAAQWGGRSAVDPKLIDHVTRRGVEFIREQSRTGTPFYLQMSHYAVHADIVYRESTLSEAMGWVPGRVHKHAGFAAMLKDLDDSLGDFMSVFDEIGLSDNTYVFFTSDNGGVPAIPPRQLQGAPYKKPALNAPLRRGKWDLTEGGIRVPLIVMGPGIATDRQCDTPVVGYDLLPTFLELAGSNKPTPPDFDGASFAPLLRGRERPSLKRPLSGTLVFHFPHYNSYGLAEPHSAIRVGDHKLLLFPDSGRTSLFDLKSDPGERTDLSASMPERVAMMRQTLEDYLASVEAEMPEQSITWSPEASGRVQARFTKAPN